MQRKPSTKIAGVPRYPELIALVNSIGFEGCGEMLPFNDRYELQLKYGAMDAELVVWVERVGRQHRANVYTLTQGGDWLVDFDYDGERWTLAASRVGDWVLGRLVGW